MTACHIPGDSATYGVGIRISFYLQWFGMIIMSWAFESDALNLKFINALTTAPTSIGLMLNLERLQPVEIHIVLLLTSGALYFTVLIYLWRLVTCCRPWWDPERWARIKTGWLSRVTTYPMYGALLSLHIWSWATPVWSRLILSSISPSSSLEPGCSPTISVSSKAVIGAEAKNGADGGATIPSPTTQGSIGWLSICDPIVAIIVTVAVELVISWNKITGMNDLDSAAQLIPALITRAFLVHGLDEKIRRVEAPL